MPLAKQLTVWGHSPNHQQTGCPKTPLIVQQNVALPTRGPRSQLYSPVGRRESRMPWALTLPSTEPVLTLGLASPTKRQTPDSRKIKSDQNHNQPLNNHQRRMLEPTKKVTLHPKTKENPQQDGRRGTIMIKVKSHTHQVGFPGGSDGKESTSNVGDLVLIPGLGRSPG